MLPWQRTLKKVIIMNYSDMELLDIFAGLNRDEIKHICECFGAHTREYAKGGAVISAGDAVKQVGVVLEGTARSVKNDVSGKMFIVALLKRGDYIGVLLAASKSRKSHVAVEAAERLTVLFLPFDKLIRQCPKFCREHSIVMRNLLGAISEKALFLHDRNDILIKPKVREKILTYLVKIAPAGGGAFTIPLNREGLADYLNIERSALSRELSRMKKDGIIDFNRSVFKIIDKNI